MLKNLFKGVLNFKNSMHGLGGGGGGYVGE